MLSGPAQKLLCGFSAGLLLLCFALPAGTKPAASLNASERIFAIGDVHGDFNSFCQILRRTGLVDDRNHWIGGNATLVQTGDVIDRGAHGRESMDLIMALQAEASKAGGNVVPLMGNHEVMNVVGDLRYVTPANYAAFADNASDKRRQDAYQKYKAWVETHAKLLAAIKEPGAVASEQEFMAQHPAGFLEYRDAFSPGSRYGKWVRGHNAVAEIGGVVFLHGGIAPQLTSLSIEQINSQVHEEIQNFDRTTQQLVSQKAALPFFTIREMVLAAQLQLLQERAANSSSDPEYHNRLVQFLDVNKWLCMRDDGPLWFRGYDSWTEEEGTQQISKILAAFHATHIVVAHTVQKTKRIRSRFGGAVFLIDTGMLSAYWPGGRASALEIKKNGTITAHYLDGDEVLLGEKQAAPPGTTN
jgi:hypothetical protein